MVVGGEFGTISGISYFLLWLSLFKELDVRVDRDSYDGALMYYISAMEGWGV